MTAREVLLKNKAASNKLYGRAAAKGLTRSKIIEVAVEIFEEQGSNDFSMRELSRRLSVYPTAIYHHLGGNRADLMSEITSVITADLMSPDEVSEDWRDTLRDLFTRYRVAAKRHPRLAFLIGSVIQANGPAHLALLEIILGALRKAGYEGPPLVDALNAVLGSLVGYITVEFAPMRQDDKPTWNEVFKDSLEHIPTDTYPNASRSSKEIRNKAFAARWSNGSTTPLDGGYKVLLESLLLGLEKRCKMVMTERQVTPLPVET